MPGILLFGIAGGAQGTAIAIAMDMKEGIIARFRTMPISRASVLTGHMLANVAQTMLALAMVVAVAVAIGFRPTTGPIAWLAAVGLLALTALAFTRISLALGLVSTSVETASNLPMPLMLLPFFGSGFVPTASMPDPLRWFADVQPFTPIIETVRRLLYGGELGATALVAVAWCVAIAVGGYLWPSDCTTAIHRARRKPGSGLRHSRRQDVVVDPEQVLGVVAALDLGQPGEL